MDLAWIFDGFELKNMNITLKMEKLMVFAEFVFRSELKKDDLGGFCMNWTKPMVDLNSRDRFEWIGWIEIVDFRLVEI